MKRILNFGSLNIDHVYTVPRIVQPGETLPTSDYHIFAGGKGANQSVALARAGATVDHAGRVGTDGQWLVDNLAAVGVGVDQTVVDPEQTTGHAVIQVEAQTGENAILLFPGANHDIPSSQIDTTLSNYGDDSILLLQNEIGNTAHILTTARDRGLYVCFNPAPFTPAVVAAYPLECVDLLIVNQTEAAGLAQRHPGHSPLELVRDLQQQLSRRTQILLTLGAEGALLTADGDPVQIPAWQAGPVIDTTAAGDTFIGYFLAARTVGANDGMALQRATAAAAICVTRAGARDSIPTASQVDALIASKHQTLNHN